MLLATDLMHPVFAEETRRHKKKRLVQGPSSYFMGVKCIGCSRVATIFSHAQTVVPCAGCSLILCRPRGGKCKLTAGEKKCHKTGTVNKVVVNYPNYINE